MPITINDCLSCGKSPDWEVLFERTTVWLTCLKCNVVAGDADLKVAVKSWNEQNPTKEEDNADNDK
jgi:hypothetical protein